MSEISIRGYHDEHYLVQRILGQSDVPAFIRRAHRTQEALDSLLAHCQRHYSENLKPVRFRLAWLTRLVPNWDALLPSLRDARELESLRCLQQALAIEPRWICGCMADIQIMRRALRELNTSIELFNQRWMLFLEHVDLRPVNEARAGYNRYYVLEKECAIRSLRVARQGFTPLPPLTLDDLAVSFPCLPTFEMKI